MYAGEGTGLVAKTTLLVGHDGQAHAESFIETFDMGKDLHEKVKRTRKSREKRSARLQEKQRLYEFDNSDGGGTMKNDQNHYPSAPPTNQLSKPQYGKLKDSPDCN